MCCWDNLPEEIRLYIISLIGQIYKDAVTKIQIKWINYTIPLKVCSLLAREQLDYDLRDNWYNITDIRFVKYLEYFSKHAIRGGQYILWVPFLDSVQIQLNSDDDITEWGDKFAIACYTRAGMAYLSLRKIYGYNRYSNDNVEYYESQKFALDSILSRLFNFLNIQ
jgi:hypothetical protein